MKIKDLGNLKPLPLSTISFWRFKYSFSKISKFENKFIILQVQTQRQLQNTISRYASIQKYNVTSREEIHGASETCR